MIPNKKFILSLMPKPVWVDKTVYPNGNNTDIIKALFEVAPKAIEQVKPVAKYFKGLTPEDTCKNIHSFIRSNLGYRRDIKGLQQIRLPNRYLIESGDCKSKALFIYSILSCIYPGNVYFRFANYDLLKGVTPSHVYVVLKVPGKKDVTIDGTYKYFNREVKPNFFKDMKIQTLSDNMSGIDFMKSKRIKNTPLKKIVGSVGKTKSYRKKGVVKLGASIPRGISDEEIGKLRLGKKLKSVGKAVGKVAKASGKAVGKAAKATGKATVKATKASGKAVGKAAKAVGKATVKAAKSVGKAGKKVALAPARGAYLALVALNVRSFASKLSKVDQNRLKRKWESLGGDFNILKTNIKRGQNKRPIGDEMEVLGIGEPVTVSLATAAPVIAAMVKEFGKDVGNEIVSDTKQKLVSTTKKSLVKKAASGLKSAGKKVTAKAVKSVVKKAEDKFNAATGGPSGSPGSSSSGQEQFDENKPESTESEKPGMSTATKVLLGAGALGFAYMATKK